MNSTTISYRQLILALFLAYLIGMGLRVIEAPSWQAGYLQINGEKLLATHDAYLWVATARGTSRIVDEALPQIVRFLHMLTGIKIGNLAFWLPAFFAPLVALPICFLAWRWNMTEAGVVGGVLAVSAIGFFLRTRLGFFDTDIGSLFFPTAFACGLAVWLGARCPLSWSKKPFPGTAVVMGTSNRADMESAPTVKFDLVWAFLLGGLCSAYKWFHPGAQKLTFPIFVLAVLTYLYLAFPELDFKFLANFLIVYGVAYAGWPGFLISVVLGVVLWTRDYFLKNEQQFLILFLIVLVLLLYFSNIFAIIVTIWNKAFYWLKPSTIEVASNNTSMLLPSIAQSIREAQNVDWNAFVSRCAGNWFVFIAGLAGYLYLVWKKPFAVLFLPFYFLAFASIKMGNRFTMYAGTGWGIGLGMGLSMLLARLKQSGLRRWLVQLILCLVVLWPTWTMARYLRPAPVLPKIYAQTFLDLNKKTSKDARLWQWWDYGYTAQYYAGRMSFCDGGLNYGDWVFPLAVVHTTNSPLQASQLMKFLTWHQRKEYKENGLKAKVPGWYPPFYMVDPMAGFRGLTPVQAQKQLLALGEKQMTFPDDLPPQYFVVSWENLRLAYWISYFGNWNLVTGKTVPGRIVRLRGTVRVDLKNGVVINGSKRIKIRGLDLIGSTGTKHFVWNNNTIFYALMNQLSRELYLMDRTIYKSMMVQMLIADPDLFNPYFELVVDHYPWARAYRVK